MTRGGRPALPPLPPGGDAGQSIHHGHGLSIPLHQGHNGMLQGHGPYGALSTRAPSVPMAPGRLAGVSRHSVETSELSTWLWIGLGIVVSLPVLYGIWLFLGGRH